MKAKVAISREESIDRAVSGALRLLALDEIIAGKTVAIKPNETWADKTDLTAITKRIPSGLYCGRSSDTLRIN